jgi:hypothetical protein
MLIPNTNIQTLQFGLPNVIAVSNSIGTMNFVGFSNATNSIDNATIDITKDMDITDYFSQAYELFNQTQTLQNEINSTNNTQTITDKSLITADWKQIKDLEQKNIKSYLVPDDIKLEMLGAEKAITDKYMVSENGPVSLTYANFKYRTIVVFLDKNQEKNGTITVENSATGQKLTLKDDATSIRSFEPRNDIPVEIRYGKFIPASCTSQSSICTPLVGGVSTALEDNVPYNSLNTLGYPATLNSQAGFVITGHTVQKLANPDEFDSGTWTPSQWIGRQIVQPFNQNNVIGTVAGVGSTKKVCDCAFVATTTQPSNSIFTSSTSQVSITYNKPSFEQYAGSFVVKSGASTGLTFGQLVSQAYAQQANVVQISVSGGDSGSPLFSYNTGTTASLIGMISSQTEGTTALYASWDYLQGRLGAIPALSNPVPPPVNLNPVMAPAGGDVFISGSGFKPNSLLTITLLSDIFSTGTNSTGGFFTYFQVPRFLPQSYVMTVSDDNGHLGTAIFTISPSTSISSSSGYAGQSGSISGTNFSPNSNVISTLGGNTIASSTTDSQGSFTATFTVPSLSPGTYQIQSTDSDGNTASTPFTITNTCSLPQSNDWNVTSSCTMSTSGTAPANVIVQPNVILTVPNGITLTIHFSTNHLLIEPGGMIMISPGGKLSS